MRYQRHPSRHSILARSLRSRSIAWALLVAQLWALMIVPLHAVAHAKPAFAAAVISAHAQNTTDPQTPTLFSRLFGHEQGTGCDDWSAAFALDIHTGLTHAGFSADIPAGAKIACDLPPAFHAFSPRSFLARAPPRN
ncbi:MAG: hypothetical protein ABI905_00925 [Betaproteobacteria bacterium]